MSSTAGYEAQLNAVLEEERRRRRRYQSCQHRSTQQALAALQLLIHSVIAARDEAAKVANIAAVHDAELNAILEADWKARKG